METEKASGTGVVDASLFATAQRLGKVYRGVRAYTKQPIGAWAIPKNPQNVSKVGLRREVYAGLLPGVIRAYGNANQQAIDSYTADYSRMVGPLGLAIGSAATGALDDQVKELARFGQKLASSDFPERLHQIGMSVLARLEATRPTALEEYLTTRSIGPAIIDALPDPERLRAWNRSRLLPALGSELPPRVVDPQKRSHLTHEDEAADLCRCLALHPEVVTIFQSYAKKAPDGTAAANRYVGQAIAATGDFAGQLREDPYHVWRYAPLVTLGVERLGLRNVDGFTEYAVELGQELGKDRLKDVVETLGWVVLCVGLVFTGPFATVGIAAVDLILTGASGFLTYLMEREQDLAALSSNFRSDGRFAEHSDYFGTKLAGAAALLGVIVLLKARGDAVQHLAHGKATGPSSVPNEPTSPPSSVGRGSRASEHTATQFRTNFPQGQKTRSVKRQPAMTRGNGRGPSYDRGLPDEPPRSAAAVGGPQEFFEEGDVINLRPEPINPRTPDDLTPVAAGKPPGSNQTKSKPSAGSKVKGTGAPGLSAPPPAIKPKRRGLKGTKPKPKLLSDAEAERLQNKYKFRAGRWYPPEEWAYIEKLEQRYPELKKARLRPEQRKWTGDEFVLDERLGTSQGGYSLTGYNDHGQQIIELDGISVDGWVEEIKIEQKNVQKCVEQIRKETDFADAFGLKGVRWSIAPPAIADEVELLLSNAVVKNAYRVR